MYCGGNPVGYRDPSGHAVALDWVNDKLSDRIDYHVAWAKHNWKKRNYFDASWDAVNLAVLGAANVIVPTSEQAEIAAMTYGVSYGPMKVGGAMKRLVSKIARNKFVKKLLKKTLKGVGRKKSSIVNWVKKRGSQGVNWITGKLGNSKQLKVVGRLEDTSVLKGAKGYDVLQIKKWTLKKNDKWIKQGIKRKQNFYIASPINKKNLKSVKYGETVFARELRMLKEAGYVKKGDYLVHPGNLPKK